MSYASVRLKAAELYAHLAVADVKAAELADDLDKAIPRGKSPQVAEYCGLNESQLSLIRSGKRDFPREVIERLRRLK